MPIVFLLCVLNVVTTVAQKRVRAKQKRVLTSALRRSLLKRMNRLTFSFHDQSRVGELQNKFFMDTSRLEAVQDYLCEAILCEGTKIIVCLTIIAMINPWYLLVLALVVPANFLAAKFLWTPMQGRNEEYRIAESRFMSYLTEALQGLRMARAHAVEAWTERRLSKASHEVADKGVRLDILNTLFGASGWALDTIFYMGVIGVGAYLCVDNQANIKDLYVFIAYFLTISASMRALINGLPVIAGASDALRSLSELYAEGAEEANQGKPRVTTVTGAIHFDAVRFRYATSDRYSLNGLSLDIPAGTSLALVGPSGSGKSTVASLVLGFYEPELGSVTIDGNNLRQVDRRSLREQMGVVSQDVVLFADTLAANIAWGDDDPDLVKVEEAARRANAHSFISEFPDGYQHVLGDRGTGLSGGQRQRIAIARALYRDPRILILDEATSALDPESERLVQAALEDLMRGRTTIIIAHRLTTVRHADSIAVMDEGELVEQGTYDELMEKNGVFHRLATGPLRE
jgi:ATP-binding cassette subfamily B protein